MHIQTLGVPEPVVTLSKAEVRNIASVLNLLHSYQAIQESSRAVIAYAKLTDFYEEELKGGEDDAAASDDD